LEVIVLTPNKNKNTRPILSRYKRPIVVNKGIGYLRIFNRAATLQGGARGIYKPDISLGLLRNEKNPLGCCSLDLTLRFNKELDCSPKKLLLTIKNFNSDFFPSFI